MIDIDAIRARRNALSEVIGAEYGFSGWVATQQKGHIEVKFNLYVLPSDFDPRIAWAEFVANAPNDVADLLEEVERLEAQVTLWRAWLNAEQACLRLDSQEGQ